MIPPVLHNNIQQRNKQNIPNFTGINTFISKAKAFSCPAQKVNLYLDKGDNKNTYGYLQKTFNKLSKDSVQKVYFSLLDSNGIANADALNVIKEMCNVPKNIFSKIFNRNNHSKDYTKYGLNFVADIIESAKDNNMNHITGNIAFVKNLLSTHSTTRVDSYFNIIKMSKDKNGVIPKQNSDMYSFLNKAKKLQYYSYLRNKDGIIDDSLRDFALKFINKNTKSINEDIWGIIKLFSTSKHSKAFITETETKLIETKLSSLRFCAEHSNDKSGSISLENYKRLANLAQNDPGLLKYYRVFRDNNKLIRNNNIDFVRTISTRIKDSNTLAKYSKIGVDNTGVVLKDYTTNLDAFFRKYPKSDSSSILTYCLERVKNPDGSINWDNMKTFYNVRSKICQINEKDSHNIFYKTLSAVKNKQGDIIPEYINQVRTLMDEDLLGEISYLLRAAKKYDGGLDLQFIDSAKKILKNAKANERIEISKYFLTCTDKNKNIDINKVQILQNILNSGIKSNVLSIAKALENPNGTYSHRGLNLIKHLRKNSHHQIEADLPKILKLCRDNTKFLNNNNIDAVKTIQAQKPFAQLSTLLKLIKTHTGEVEQSKLKALGYVLKEFRGKRMHSYTLNDAIRYSTDSNNNCDFNMMQIITRISKSGDNINSYKDLFPAFRDFAKYSRVTSFDQLNLQQKRDIMRKIKNNKDVLENLRFRKYLDIKMLPTNDSDYCVCLARLSHSIGINVKPLDQKLISGFFGAMNKMSSPNSEFMKLDFNKNVPKLSLTYPLEDFQKDVWSVINNLSYGERTKAIDYFGFELKKRNNHFVMNGFPCADKPDGRLASIKDKTVQNTISKLTPYVIKFTQGNNVHVANQPNLSAELTDIVRAFPEFLTTVGKVQHTTHDYTLDIHLLKVLQGVFKNPHYQQLSDSSKKQLQISALLHDLTKSAGEVDKYHPENSAFDIYYLLDKFKMKEKDKLKIYHIVKNHAWLARYNKSNAKDFVAKDLAFELRQNDAFKMISILAEADLKGIKKYDAFYNKYKADLVNAEKKISPIVYHLQKTAINLPQTRIPKISEINHKSPYVSVINKDGIKNTVIILRQGIDLSKVGFDANVSLSDLNILVHGLDNKDQAAMFQALGVINSDALLSTSYINYRKGNWRVFRQQGFVLGVPSVDIHAGYWRDFGSGHKKGIKDLFSTYLFSKSEMRTYFSDKLKTKLNLSDSEYINLIGKIADLPITELDKYYPKVANAYRKIFNDMDVSKRSYGRNYNEILVTRPKIQGVFCYSQLPEHISPYLRRYAEKNDIPILIF